MTPHFLSLLAQLDPVKAREYSMLDHHAKGVDYLNLFRSDKLTVKLYMSRPLDLVFGGRGNYLVHPHDHAYEFDTYVLDGPIQNVMFEVKKTASGNHRQAIWSTSRREFELPSHDWRWELEPASRTFVAGEGYHLGTDAIHTLVIPKTHRVALGIVQYADQRDWSSCYLPGGEKPDLTGLYNVPTIEQTEALIAKAREVLSQ